MGGGGQQTEGGEERWEVRLSTGDNRSLGAAWWSRYYFCLGVCVGGRRSCGPENLLYRVIPARHVLTRDPN